MFLEAFFSIDAHRFSSLCSVNNLVQAAQSLIQAKSIGINCKSNLFPSECESIDTDKTAKGSKKEQDSVSSWTVRTDMTSSTLRIKVSLRSARDQGMISRS